jgi:hypothetical protein
LFPPFDDQRLEDRPRHFSCSESGDFQNAVSLFGKLVSAIMPDHDGLWSVQVSGQHLDIALAVTQ